MYRYYRYINRDCRFIDDAFTACIEMLWRKAKPEMPLYISQPKPSGPTVQRETALKNTKVKHHSLAFAAMSWKHKTRRVHESLAPRTQPSVVGIDVGGSLYHVLERTIGGDPLSVHVPLVPL